MEAVRINPSIALRLPVLAAASGAAAGCTAMAPMMAATMAAIPCSAGALWGARLAWDVEDKRAGESALLVAGGVTSGMAVATLPVTAPLAYMVGDVFKLQLHADHRRYEQERRA